MSKNNKKGFTIIEVVLVLAIAGLIFLMVFIALPALQRSQRDTQRRQDLSRIASAVTQYQSNNKNKLPFEPNSTGAPAKYLDEKSDFVKNYVMAGDEEQFQDPDGTFYKIYGYPTGTMSASGGVYKVPAPDDHTINAYVGFYCGDKEGELKAASGKTMFALTYKLEGGAVTCVDNQ